MLSCPAERGLPCSPSIPIPTHSSSLHQSPNNPQYSLSWDNYSESPSFSLSAGWTGLVSDIPVLSTWPAERSVLVSETDPFALDASDTASQQEVEVLRGDSEDEIGDNLVDSGPGELSLTPTVTGASESGRGFPGESSVADIEESTRMDQSKVDILQGLLQKIEDEMDDLVPEQITRGEAGQVESDLTRIWDDKNMFRNLVRDLVSPFDSEDRGRKKWEQTCKEVVAKVINHKKKVRAER